MSILTAIPLYVNPNVRPGLNALAAFLVVERYTAHSRERIIEHVACHGTLAGLVEIGLLERTDAAIAEQIYVDALEPVCPCDPAWEDEGRWMALEDTQELPTISGGAPEPVLTDEERTEFEAWLDVVDAPRPHPHQTMSFSEWLDSQGGIAWEEGRD